MGEGGRCLAMNCSQGTRKNGAGECPPAHVLYRFGNSASMRRVGLSAVFRVDYREAWPTVGNRSIVGFTALRRSAKLRQGYRLVLRAEGAGVLFRRCIGRVLVCHLASG